MIRPALSIISLLLLFGSLLLWNGSGALAASPGLPQGGGVVLTPSDSQGNQLDGPGYFEVTAAPGSTTTLYALVGNVQQHHVGIDIVPVDARSGVYGGVSYDLPRQPRKSVGAWITLSIHNVVLSARKATVVMLTLHVPAGTASGQYVGGLTAFVPTTSTVRGPHQRAGAIQLQLRRIVAVVVTVPGPAFSRFEIGSVKAKRRPDAFYLITHIHNTGTVLLKGQGHLWVWRQGVKKAVVSSSISVDTTLPHTTVHYPILWSRNPARGIYRYSAVLSWGGGKCARAGTFVIR